MYFPSHGFTVTCAHQATSTAGDAVCSAKPAPCGPRRPLPALPQDRLFRRSPHLERRSDATAAAGISGVGTDNTARSGYGGDDGSMAAGGAGRSGATAHAVRGVPAVMPVSTPKGRRKARVLSFAGGKSPRRMAATWHTRRIASSPGPMNSGPPQTPKGQGRGRRSTANAGARGHSTRRAFIGVIRVARLDAIQLAPAAASVSSKAPNT